MNVVVFASDSKHASYLNSIVNVLNERGIRYFAFFNMNTASLDPLSSKPSYTAYSNVDSSEQYFSESLGINLPFEPDWLLVSRERWSPEDRLIYEFKNKFGAKVGLVEPNSAFINSVNQYLESESRNRFTNVVDVYFDHSTFILNQRRLLGFKGNSVVVGNPKYDQNLNVDIDTLNAIKDFYKVDNSKKQVLFFTLQNKYRYKLFQKFREFKDNNPQYQYFVKPYPGEPFNPTYKSEYFPKFFIDGVTPILEDIHIWSMFNICDIHIGCISSVMYPSYLLEKEVYEYSKDIGARERLDSNSDILNSSGGHEDNLSIWLSVLNMSKLEFAASTSKERLRPMLKENNTIWNYLNNSLSYKKEIIKLYDEFSDGKASERIVDYINSYEL